LTEYGKKINIRLIEKEMTQIQLMEQVTKKTGLYVDDGYMCKIKNGKRSPRAIINAINEILEIES
jgi:hypothetical protein